MEDCVTEFLKREGYRVVDEMMGNSPIKLGNAVFWRHSKFTYKVEPEDTLVIICYERMGKQRGLGNGFRDIFEWLTAIKNNLKQIKQVTGRVNALVATDVSNGLTTDKLLRFYRDIMQSPSADEIGESWFRFELDDLKNFRTHYRANAVKHMSQRKMTGMQKRRTEVSS